MNKQEIENRRKELRSLSYGKLQSTREYKDYLSSYVYNASQNMTTEVEYILKKSYEDSDAPFSYDDIDTHHYNDEDLIEAIVEHVENCYDEEDDSDIKEIFNEIDENINGTNPINLYDEKKELKDNLETLKLHLKDQYQDTLKEIVEDICQLQIEEYEEQAEILQWFAMDSRMLYQLEKHGEIILDDSYWGRQCFGQMIDMDGVIIDIFKEWYLGNDYEIEKVNEAEQKYDSFADLLNHLENKGFYVNDMSPNGDNIYTNKENTFSFRLEEEKHE